MAGADYEARRRILLLGPRGQLGWELRRSLAPLGEVIAAGRDHIDLAALATLKDAADGLRPALIVNAAAYTAVDAAEGDEETAMRVNGLAPGLLAEVARARGIPLVHFSTDYVFDGATRGSGRDGGFTEADPVGPCNAYGRTKLAGEDAIRDAARAHLIFRTAWIYAARGRNFLLTMRRLGRERDEITIVDDQRGSPTWARALADATAQVLARHWAARPPDALTAVAGTYHLASAGQTSWHGFARAIFATASDADRATPTLRPVPTSAFPTPARRPAWSVLDCGKARRTFGIALPHWRTGLELCLDVDRSGQR
jgi:dTDP-4-dehydrorhamnose reductase